jgi:hypothetical protein
MIFETSLEESGVAFYKIAACAAIALIKAKYKQA